MPRPVDGLFTYRVPFEWIDFVKKGAWVRVPFGRSTTPAFIAGPLLKRTQLTDNFPIEKVKGLLEVGGEETSLPDSVWELCQWAAEYYRAPLGEVLGVAFPFSVLTKNSKRAVKETELAPVKSLKKLTTSQQAALEQLRGAHGQVALLHGVTGSGKTELYIERARDCLSQGKSVLLLVPEIALTPALHARIEGALQERVALWHSALPEGRRRSEWKSMRSGTIRVVLGARSAVFAPLQDLGLIVVDEEHDTSYKQEDRVHYSARDLAVVRGMKEKASVVLGSATPSLESLERAREGRFVHVLLSERVGVGGSPVVELVDLTEEVWVEGTQAVLAEKTLNTIRETIASGQQVMIYLNRRGFAAYLVCGDCGDVPGCPDCSISLTYHKRQLHLRCHVCGYHAPVPDQCSSCRGLSMRPMGAGTESLEEQLPALVPDMKALRLDRDQVTSATRLTEILDEFRQGKANTLLGTQMLVKGHDFPSVTLVVIMLADSLFRWPDFRAPERALQILTQMAGRAGRGELPGRVLIQTFKPSHPVNEVLIGKRSIDSFLEEERELRKLLSYPPFSRMARLRVESSDREVARNISQQLARVCEDTGATHGIEVLGPSEAFLEKAKGVFRWDVLLKSTKGIAPLHLVITSAKQKLSVSNYTLLVDIDPSGIA